jgi:tetratricopeptide (TPR) repeat protein
MSAALRWISVVSVVLVLACASAPSAAAITECDRLATHPADPDKPLPGLEREAIDLQKAEAACRAAVADDPYHARSHYQLGRVLFYQKKTAEAMPHLERASALGYRQAVFVLGYVYVLGQAVPQDSCRTAKLWRQSGGLEHPWTGYYLVEYYLNGAFKDCKLTLSNAELERYLAQSQSTLTVSASEGRVEKLAERVRQHIAAQNGVKP